MANESCRRSAELSRNQIVLGLCQYHEPFIQSWEQAGIEIVPAQFVDGVVRVDMGIEDIDNDFSGVDPGVNVMERGASLEQWRYRSGFHGLPIDDFDSLRAIERIQRGMRPTTLVRRV